MALTVVMYHYVRDLRHSRFPEIKGRSVEEFKGQVGYIKKHYNVINGNDLLEAATSGSPLPPKALLLTFDDGYIDHFTCVYPILDREHLPGCFFPPARCILERSVLDVNKIHFILAAVPDKDVLVEFILQAMDENREHYSLPPADYYWQKLAGEKRFDTRQVVFIKRMLQRELPDELRMVITNALFARYVSADEVSFAGELYMDVEQLACLCRNGMYVGSHGYDHRWLNTLPPEQQEHEIRSALSFLEQIGSRTDRWIMCYPYGAHDESLASVLLRMGCKAGLTTQVGIAAVQSVQWLTLPRLDTNDLPLAAGTAPNQWTLQA